jgi:hypothetical protein
MKAMYLLLVSLCFFLSGGRVNSAYAVANHNKVTYTPAHQVQELQQIDRFSDNKDAAIFRAAGANDEDKLLFSSENEDENDLSARKYILLTKYSLILTYTFILSNLCVCVKDRIPFCSHLSYISSYKYIVQRALKI